MTDIRKTLDQLIGLTKAYIPIGNKVVEEIRKEYYAGEGTGEERVKRALGTLATIHKVKIDYKRFYLMAELLAREALEKRAEGDIEAYSYNLKMAGLIFEGEEDKFTKLMQSREYIVEDREIKANFFKKMEFSIKKLYKKNGTLKFADRSDYKKAKAIYEFAKKAEASKRENPWKDEEILNDNADLHDKLYHYLLKYVDFKDGIFQMIDSTHEGKFVMGPLGFMDDIDPLAQEIFALNNRNRKELRRAIERNPNNLRMQKELLEIMWPRRMDPYIAMLMLETKSKTVIADGIISQWQTIRRTYENLIAASSKNLQRTEYLKREYAEFLHYFGAECYSILKKHTSLLYKDKPFIFPSRFTNFNSPQMLEILITAAEESITESRKLTKGLNNPEKIGLTIFAEDKDILPELYYATGNFKAAISSGVLTNDAKKTIIQAAGDRVQIFDLYKDIVLNLIRLEEPKKGQSELDELLIDTYDRKNRHKIEKELRSHNKICLALYKDINSKVQKAFELIKKQPLLSQIRYRREFFTMVAAVELNMEEYLSKLREIISLRGKSDPFVKDLLIEASAWNSVYRKLEPDIYRHEVVNMLEEEAGENVYPMYKRLREIFSGLNVFLKFNAGSLGEIGLGPEIEERLRDIKDKKDKWKGDYGFLMETLENLERDFKRWEGFEKTARSKLDDLFGNVDPEEEARKENEKKEEEKKQKTIWKLITTLPKDTEIEKKRLNDIKNWRPSTHVNLLPPEYRPPKGWIERWFG
ncbi:MAG: hypothetical protein KAT43_03995 [Nanoarchaeota archaeon]|nr:hypothetical protein [Nanoarchaeota archaeon]